MKRSGEIRWGELRLGLLIFVSMMIFLWASIQGGSSLFKKEYTLHSRFSNVQGVVSGAPIWFQGVEVGTVKSLDFVPVGDTSGVAVTFKVDHKIFPLIRRNSRVRIQALNVFGEKFIEVTPGTRESPRVSNGDTLASERPFDMAEIMERGNKIVDHLVIAGQCGRDQQRVVAGCRQPGGRARFGGARLAALLATEDQLVHDAVRTAQRPAKSQRTPIQPCRPRPW